MQRGCRVYTGEIGGDELGFGEFRAQGLRMVPCGVGFRVGFGVGSLGIRGWSSDL